MNSPEPGRRHRACGAAGTVTAAPRSRPGPGCRRCPCRRRREVEVVGGHRCDVVEQFGGPRRVGQRARDLGVDDRSAVALVELDQPRGHGTPRASTSTEKPAPDSSSVSSAALSSRVWNGLIGVSRPGEKVIRLGVDISSTPPGRSTRKHSATNCPWSQRCSITWKLTTTSTAPSAQRQLGQVAVAHLHPRVAGADVGDR